MKLITFLQLAALLHVGLVCAGATMPRAVRLSQHLATLPPFIRHLFWVYYTFIGSCLIGFGLLTWFCAGAMAAGEPTARALSVFLGAFWCLRLMVGAFVLDVRPYLTNRLYRIGYAALNAIFLYLTGVYAWTALKGVDL